VKVLFTHSAQRDLVRLRDFIATKNPSAAERISNRVVVAIKRLADQPGMGVDVEEIPGTQDLITGDYIVRYAVIDEEVYVLRIWHGKEER
jgi:addiction module RelE/StbE family toxin